MATHFNYENRIVCFIDILAFSSLIKATARNGEGAEEKLTNICGAIRTIHSIAEIVRREAAIEGAVTTQFSDSIVISFPYREDDKSILIAFAAIKFMQILLIKNHDILLRGGIVRGEIIHNNEMLVGPAMVAAYELESKCAVSPRIVIDPKVAFSYNRILRKLNKEWGGTSVIHKDSDDTYYIDYFNFLQDEDMMSQDEMKDYFTTLCSMVAKNVESSDMSIRIKYLWMRNKIKSSKPFLIPQYARIYKQVVTNKRDKN